MKIYLVLETNFGTEGDFGSSTALIWASLDKKKAQDFIDEKEANLNEDGTMKDDFEDLEEWDDEEDYWPDMSRYGYHLLEYELEKEEYEHIDGQIE